MRIIAPSHELLHLPDPGQVLRLVELAGRTCYKSEDRITPDSAADFVGRILKSGHLSVLEHASLSVRLVCDRGVSHELVRHRLASFSQESTRYANYAKDRFGGEITVIRPLFWEPGSREYELWHQAMLQAERVYLDLLAAGCQAQQARSVLPNSLKTEVVMTANLREWRHVFNLRCDGASHPQMRELMLPLLGELAGLLPAAFADLGERFQADRERFAAMAQGLDG